MTTKFLIPLMVCLFTMSVALAGPVVGWRMDGTGTFAAATPPTEWSADAHVIWKTPLAKWSNSSPIIVGDRLFICAEPSTLVCVNPADGQVLWTRDNGYDAMMSAAEQQQFPIEEAQVAALSKEMAPLEKDLRDQKKALTEKPDDVVIQARVEALTAQVAALRAKADALPVAKKWAQPKTHADNGYSSDTPASDGKFVYAQFGTGVVACYDLDGNLQWRRLFEKPTHGWGHSNSPLLIGGTLLVQFNATLYGLAPDSGDTRWTAAVSPAWGSPVALRLGATNLAVTAGGHVVRVEDGKVLDRIYEKGLVYNSPLVQGDTVYFIQENAAAVTLALKADGTLEQRPLWQATIAKDRYYGSPVVRDGVIYGITQKSLLTALDAQTGERLFEEKLNLGGTAYPSITLAGNTVFVSSDNGKTVLLAPGREYKVLGTATLEKFRCSPVFIGTRMYVRGYQHLYCIGD